ncbi:MAG: hypothetical protein WA985_07320, partial [Erythrobacter sp.]
LLLPFGAAFLLPFGTAVLGTAFLAAFGSTLRTVFAATFGTAFTHFVARPLDLARALLVTGTLALGTPLGAALRPALATRRLLFRTRFGSAGRCLC